MAYQYISLYRQTLADRQDRYNESILSGEYTPFLYPWDSLPALYLVLAITGTPRLPLRLARVLRFLIFILILLHSSYIVSHRRTLWFAGGYGIGLSSAWGLIMSGAVLICNDIAHDFERLEIQTVPLSDSHSLQNGCLAESSATGVSGSIDLTQRKVASVYTSADTKQSSLSSSKLAATKPYKLTWQGFPHDGTWLHLIDWTVDLVTSFRGAGWKHRISTIGPVDIPTLPDLAENQSQKEPTAVSVQNLRSLQLRAVQDFMICYLLLDFLKTTMITDPYFLGLASLESPSPWSWLDNINQRVPFATRLVRLFMSMAGVISALTFIFSLSPLAFTTILPCVINVSAITKAPLFEPALYPPMWYPLATSVLYSGLAGFWGKFWHQMFRFGISEPSRVLIERFHLDPRGDVARVIQLLIAFGLSGSIHGLGSYTSFSLQPSHPLTGSLAFFLFQGFGIFLQSSVVKVLHKRIAWTRTAPATIRQTSNLMFVLLYLYFTGPLLANDFSRCGIWLFEPVPVSLLRGLGFGPGGKDEGWWAWYQEGSRVLGWWKGDTWWDKALAIY